MANKKDLGDLDQAALVQKLYFAGLRASVYADMAQPVRAGISVDRTAARHYLDTATGLRYFSVSQICAALRPAERYISTATSEAMQQAMQRGADLHKIFALLLLGLPHSVPDDYAGYYKSMRGWTDKHSPKPLLVEAPGVADFHGQAWGGTPDCLVEIGALEYLVELKTGPPQPWHRVQVQAYGRLSGYTGAGEPRRLAPALRLLYVQADGSPAKYVRVIPSPRDMAAFCSALNILIWRDSQ